MENNDNPAAFQFVSYHFTKAKLDFSFWQGGGELTVTFTPKGIYEEQEGMFHLTLDTEVLWGEEEKPVANITCEAVFSFPNKPQIDHIPDFFYPNALAIVFPYVRAFISTMSLQANLRPIMLPTFNLINLKDKFKESTIKG